MSKAHLITVMERLITMIQGNNTAVGYHCNQVFITVIEPNKVR